MPRTARAGSGFCPMTSTPSAQPPPPAVLVVLGFATIYVVWGSTYLGIRWAVETIPPFLMGGSRFLLAGGVLQLAAAMGTGEWSGFAWADLSVRSALAWGYLVAVGSLVAFSTYVWLLRASTPARVSTYAYVNPVIAVFLGWALAAETVSGRTLAAAGVIVAAVVIITRPKR